MGVFPFACDAGLWMEDESNAASMALRLQGGHGILHLRQLVSVMSDLPLVCGDGGYESLPFGEERSVRLHRGILRYEATAA